MKTKLLFAFFAMLFFNLSYSQTTISIFQNVLFYDGYAGTVNESTEPNAVRLKK